jgi:hypothetical protein
VDDPGDDDDGDDGQGQDGAEHDGAEAAACRSWLHALQGTTAALALPEENVRGTEKSLREQRVSADMPESLPAS